MFKDFLVPEDDTILNAINKDIKEAEIKKEEEKATKLADIQAQATLAEKKSGTIKRYTPSERIEGHVLTYLVFQGDTYDEECKGQFMWAPKYTKGGTICHHWDRLMDVREGDIIFHCSNRYIMAISRAKSAFQDSARPDQTKDDWMQREKDGRRIDCEYYTLKTPLNHGKFKNKIIEYSNVKYAPFDKHGNGNMGYLFELNSNLASFFVKEIAKENADVLDLDYLQFLLK